MMNMNTKKIMYIVPYPMLGGGEVWIKEMISRLDKSKFEPMIVYPTGKHKKFDEFFGNIKSDIIFCLIEYNTISVSVVLKIGSHSLWGLICSMLKR